MKFCKFKMIAVTCSGCCLGMQPRVAVAEVQADWKWTAGTLAFENAPQLSDTDQGMHSLAMQKIASRAVRRIEGH